LIRAIGGRESHENGFLHYRGGPLHGRDDEFRKTRPQAMVRNFNYVSGSRSSGLRPSVGMQRFQDIMYLITAICFLIAALAPFVWK